LHPTVCRRAAWSVLLALAISVAAGVAAGPAAAQDWSPPTPGEDKWEWIQMKSGEWFKGTIKSLRDGDLEFDSDELGVLQLDWGDVTTLRSTVVSSYRIESVGVFVGTAILQNSQLSIRSADGTVQTFPQSSVLLMVPGTGREFDFWYAKATLGLVARSGNTDQSDFNAQARVRRRTPKSRLLLTYLGNVGEIEGTANIENHNLTGSVDMVIRSGFYLTPVSVNYFKDRFQNISAKTTVSAGLGYQAFRTSRIDWDINLSAGYQDTRFASVQPGEADTEDNFSVIPATSVSFDITSDIDFGFDYNAQIGLPDAERAFHHANFVLSIDLYGNLFDLDLSLTWDRTESPKADSSGLVPKRDDWRTAIGIGIEL
jgi:putative salt-induced outer membrane protein YdiY